MSAEHRIARLRRRFFGRYEVEDPRPIAEGAPYTFYLPSENELLAIAPGDLVKLVIASVPPSPLHAAERMWVEVTRVGPDRCVGRLQNIPFDMPQLKLGRTIRFGRNDVIDIDWNADRAVTPPSAPARRWYWERCLVDAAVIDDGARVGYLYREAPEMTAPEDAYPDSGWRIRALVDDDAYSDDAPLYIALGKVLNADDSWLHLIDEPAGCAFIREAADQPFARCVD